MNSSASTTPLNTSPVEIQFRILRNEKATRRPERHTLRIVLAILPLLLLLAVVIAVIIILFPSNSSRSSSILMNSKQTKCQPSSEAKQIGLHTFVVKLEKEFFRLHPELVPSKPGVTPEEIRQTYRPYDPRPTAIKTYTDETKRLHKELMELMANTNESKLKLRERNVAHLALFHLLKHSFEWGPYHRDYYAGDWMLEPNMYCWQPICNVIGNLGAAVESFKPTDARGVERLIEMLGWHNNTIIQYVENMKMGVSRGMVRSKHSCRAGLRALTRVYENVALYNENGILKGYIAFAILDDPNFLNQITPEVNSSWIVKHGIGVHESLKQSLVDLLGKPLAALLRYMKFEHMRHCVSDDKFSGLHSLPLAHQYVDDAIQNSKLSIHTLPTGETLNGSQSYLRLFSFFTQNGVTPEQLRSEGYAKLDQLLEKVKEIAKNYTKEDNETTAVIRFREVLESQEMFYNSEPFPANESDENAFMKCGDRMRAPEFCPKRWEAFQRWKESVENISRRIPPKLHTLFYYSGNKTTTPKCNIAVAPELSPDVCFHGYEGGWSCLESAYQTLPFFMDNFGPRYTEYTTTIHEQNPGHHLEVQGFMENFRDTCEDSISFFLNWNYIPAFTEGWATYVEYPLVFMHTDIYGDGDEKKVLLLKYGMYKYQILAALRSVLDSGINYFGMKRYEAVELFDKYAWDTSDLVTKDITRFQSAPGTVTSYMASQASFVRVLELAQKELGASFSFPEFHYQVLRQGEVTLEYLEQHIRRYVECTKDSSRDGCSEILEK